MWQLEDWVLAIGHQEVQMRALAPHWAGLHMMKKRNMKVGGDDDDGAEDDEEQDVQYDEIGMS
jgi:hypothetical protein